MNSFSWWWAPYCHYKPAFFVDQKYGSHTGKHAHVRKLRASARRKK